MVGSREGSVEEEYGFGVENTEIICDLFVEIFTRPFQKSEQFFLTLRK